MYTYIPVHIQGGAKVEGQFFCMENNTVSNNTTLDGCAQWLEHWPIN